MDTHDDFVAARRPALLEEYGGGAAVEAAVDRALARCRRGWSRLEQTTDVETHVRDLIAEELDRPRRRRLTLIALAALLLLGAGAVGVSLLPAPPEVREEANRLPVPWFAEGELHLADVVVTLPGAGSFVRVGEDVVIEDANGGLVRVEPDGDVSGFDEAFPVVTEPEVAAPYDPLLSISQRLGVARAPDGRSVHLMELAVSGPDTGTFLRQSEGARRLFLVCSDPACEVTTRIVVPGNDVRLR